MQRKYLCIEKPRLRNDVSRFERKTHPDRGTEIVSATYGTGSAEGVGLGNEISQVPKENGSGIRFAHSARDPPLRELAGYGISIIDLDVGVGLWDGIPVHQKTTVEE